MLRMPSSTLSTVTQHARVRWHSPMLVKASIGCHLGAAAAFAAEPGWWPWCIAALLFDHAVISAAGLWPRSSWLGSNLRSLPAAAVARREVAITIDDGPDPEVTPAVLDLLEAHGALATFFCIGEQAERHPALCCEIVARGHSVTLPQAMDTSAQPRS
jgi:hypothetical protein